ncbi:hypothetical protein MKZ38_003209 [Zalerion maritima]|uniref:Sm domain-containing protein n=1 Tax=Zalerion maritima TaxID=339359 RepID=A0AAD5S0Y5_9PEZI|nr:hypothetical protein MKZ38_003209 [Zalerion maritima]
MLPLGLLNAAQGHPMLVELKNGETLNGHLVQTDTWMNLTLKEVVQTSPEGDKFVRLPEVYVKGNNSNKPSNNSRDITTNTREVSEVAEAGNKEVIMEDVVGTGEEEVGAKEEVAAGDVAHELRLKYTALGLWMLYWEGSQHTSEKPSSFLDSVTFEIAGNCNNTRRADGLWRCLCPYVDPIVLTRPFEDRLGLITPWRPGQPKHQNDPRSAGVSKSTYHDLAGPILRDFRNQSGLNHEGGSPKASGTHWVTPEMLVKATPPYDHLLSGASVNSIYGALFELRNVESSLQKASSFVTHLIRDRKEHPHVRMYEGLIHANAGRHGSADAILDFLDGMEGHGISPSSFLCHATLRALVNHPDYLIREDILRIMKARWYEVRPHGHIDIMLGQLRDCQYEMATEKLEQHFARGDTLPAFVYDIFVYKFAEVGLFDDALRILHHRLRNLGRAANLNPSAAQWFYLLDRAAEDMHYRCVKYVWQRQVLITQAKQYDKNRSTQKIMPTDGTIENILTLASRHGDVPLAMQAMKMLTTRGTRLRRPHYETLIECYVAAGQLDNAALALSIMQNAQCVPTRATTRPIFQALVADPEHLDTAIGWLVPQMVNEEGGGKKIQKPCPQAFAVALEAVLHVRGWDGPSGALEMLERAVNENRIGLDADSFNVIIRESVDLSTVEKVEKLMLQSRATINSESLNLFLTIYSSFGRYDAARRWGAILVSKKVMRKNKLVPSLDAVTNFVHRAATEKDSLVVTVVAHCNGRGMQLHPDLVRRVKDFARQIKKAKGEGKKEEQVSPEETPDSGMTTTADTTTSTGSAETEAITANEQGD